MKKLNLLIVLIVCLTLIFSACGSVDVETTAQNAQTTTAVHETDEITTGAMVESAEQTEALSREITYEAVYSGSWGPKGGDTAGFILINDRDELEKFVNLDEQSDAKYDHEWFETHALICAKMGHYSCDRAALNRIEIGERAVTIFIDVIHSADEKRYEKKGKDYEVSYSVGNNHHAATNYTWFFVEFDGNGKEIFRTLHCAIVKRREWPASEWREREIKLWIEE